MNTQENIFNINKIEKDSRKHYIINASAGTGKTFALIQTIKHIAGQEFCNASKILVLTFSNAAKREIKTRLMDLSQQSTEPVDASKIALLQELDLIRVATFHQFSKDILMAYGKHPCFDVDNLDSIIAKSFAFLLKHIHKYVYIAPQYDNSYALKLLKNALISRSRGSSSNLIMLEDMIFKLCREALIHTHEFIPNHIYKKLQSKFFSMIRGCPLFDGSKQKDVDLEWWHMIAIASHLIANKIDPSNYSHPTFSSEWNLFLRYLIKSIQHLVMSSCKKIRCPIQIFGLLFALQRQLKHTLEYDWSYIGFDDILHRALDLIELPSILHECKQTYDYILIDESQDTDSTQWNIIKKLIHPATDDAPRILLFGDEKQTIYNFRGVDKQTYSSGKKMLMKLGAEIFDLPINYRATTTMTNAINWMFCNLCIENQPFAQSVLSRPNSVESNDIEAELIWIKATDKDAIGRLLIREIISHIPKKKTQAILCRTNHDVEYWAHQLRLAGVPCFSPSSTNKIVESLLYILSLNIPIAQNMLKFVATSPIWGLSLQEALEMSDQQLENIASLTTALIVHISEYGLCTALIGLLKSKHPVYHNMLMAELLAQRCPYILESLEYLMTNIEHTPTSNPIYELKYKLKLLLTTHYVNNNRNWDVSIITAHGSKGLEFDIVYNLTSSSKSGDDLYEDMQLFYVACTRAKQCLYLWDTSDSNSVLTTWKTHHNASSIEGFKSMSIEHPSDDISMTSPIVHNVSWLCTKHAHVSQNRTRVKSYTSEKQTELQNIDFISNDNNETVLSDGISGRHIGIATHSVLEHIKFDSTITNINKAVLSTIKQSPYKADFTDQDIALITDMVLKAITMEIHHRQSLEHLSSIFDIQREVDFFFKQDNDIFKGQIDLMFFDNNTCYLVDWKTDSLQVGDEQEIERIVSEKYSLQAQIYSKAVRNFMPNLDNVIIKYIFLKCNTPGMYELEFSNRQRQNE